MLTEAQKLARAGKLTASRVAPLMTGDKAKIMAVWRELCGDPTYEEENLDEVWAVQLGSTTEQLNLDWFEQKNDCKLTRRGDVVIHPDYEWAAATLDGFHEGLPGPIEAKHVSGFEPIEKVVERYRPQCEWQMEVTGTTKCVLSVIEGARVPRLVELDRNPEYADELMSRAHKLMVHVYNMTEPVEMEPVESKIISRLKDYNFTGNNAWASAASSWLSHKDSAKKFKEAETEIRGMFPNDGASAVGYSIIAKRDKANRISIKPIADDKPGPKPTKR